MTQQADTLREEQAAGNRYILWRTQCSAAHRYCCRALSVETQKIEEACSSGINALKDGLMNNFDEFGRALRRVGESATEALVAERQVLLLTMPLLLSGAAVARLVHVAAAAAIHRQRFCSMVMVVVQEREADTCECLERLRQMHDAHVRCTALATPSNAGGGCRST
jgi:hypothetical protein